MSTTSPRWDPRNLTRHHRKRTTGKDAGCFEDLLGIIGRVMTEGEYETRSIEAFDNAWAEYEGEHRDIGGTGEFDELRAYYVDDVLVVVVTDTFRRDVVTCFHEHFDRRHASPNGSVGQRRLRYKERVQFEEEADLIRNVRRIRGV